MTEIPNTAPKFTFDGIRCQARVVKVYDGDSFDVIFPFKDTYYQIHCRAHGYNSPELRATDENVKIAGYQARDYLRVKIYGKVFNIDFLHDDKYGRPLVILYLENTTLDKLMIAAGHGIEYIL